MLSNEKLKEKLKNKLKELSLEPEQEERLVRELNYFSQLIIDVYLKNNVNYKPS